MNTQVISSRFFVGMIIVSLVGAVFAFMPVNAQAAEMKQAVNPMCMQTAVDTREDAIAAAFSGFNDSIKTALSARKAALHAAWGLSDKAARSTSVKAAWKTWKDADKKAHDDLKKNRKAAWSTFKTTTKSTCHQTLPKEEGLDADTSGSVAL